MYGQKANLPSKAQIQVLLTKIKEYYNLQKERKSNEVVKEERQLVKVLKGEGRSKLEEALLMEKIVNLLRNINALRLLGSYADALRQNSACLSAPAQYKSQVHQLLPYIMGIIYSSKPTGLNCIDQFKQVVEEIFGKQSLEMAYTQGNMIPKDVRKCYEPITPNFMEINQYAIEMCQRNQISLESLNSVGHQFSVYGGQLNIAVGGQRNSYRQQVVGGRPSQGDGRGSGGNRNSYGLGGNRTGGGNRGSHDYGNNGYENNQVQPRVGVSPGKAGNYVGYNDNNGGQNKGSPNNPAYYPKSPQKPPVNYPQTIPKPPSSQFQPIVNNYQYGGDYTPTYTPNQSLPPTNQLHSSYLPRYKPTNFEQEFKIPAPPQSTIDPADFNFPKNQSDLESRLKKL